MAHDLIWCYFKLFTDICQDCSHVSFHKELLITPWMSCWGASVREPDFSGHENLSGQYGDGISSMTCTDRTGRHRDAEPVFMWLLNQYRCSTCVVPSGSKWRICCVRRVEGTWSCRPGKPETEEDFLLGDQCWENWSPDTNSRPCMVFSWWTSAGLQDWKRVPHGHRDCRPWGGRWWTLYFQQFFAVPLLHQGDSKVVKRFMTKLIHTLKNIATLEPRCRTRWGAGVQPSGRTQAPVAIFHWKTMCLRQGAGPVTVEPRRGRGCTWSRMEQKRALEVRGRGREGRAEMAEEDKLKRTPSYAPEIARTFEYRSDSPGYRIIREEVRSAVNN